MRKQETLNVIRLIPNKVVANKSLQLWCFHVPIVRIGGNNSYSTRNKARFSVEVVLSLSLAPVTHFVRASLFIDLFRHAKSIFHYLLHCGENMRYFLLKRLVQIMKRFNCLLQRSRWSQIQFVQVLKIFTLKYTIKSTHRRESKLILDATSYTLTCCCIWLFASFQGNMYILSENTYIY